tara:strand:+ start:237 stop:818 length:582 start_codon:yes stop_codon:yes gene_type:complete
MLIESFILAAGSSKRTGKVNKLLKKYKNKPLIEHTIQIYLNSKVSRVNIITGYEKDKIEKIANKFNILTYHNKDYKKGLLSSIKTAIRNINKSSTGVMIGLADMPLVKPKDLDNLITQFMNYKSKKICVPVCYKKIGNPIVFPSQLLKVIAKDIKKENKDEGLKSIILKKDYICVKASKGTLKDFDQLSDYII